MDGRANTDALNAALRGCSKTHRQEAAGGGRQWLGGDGGGGGGLAGAGWVAGRGGRRRGSPLGCVSSSTVAGYSCSEMSTHSANCAADRRDSSGAVLGPVLDMQGRRHLRRGADADSYGPSIQKNIEILQLQYIDKVIDVGFASRAVPRCIRGGDSRAPTVAPTAWTVVAMPVVVQRQLHGSDV